MCPDRREYLDPQNFGEGRELGVFGNNGSGVMLALGVLLAPTNGWGEGDVRMHRDGGVTNAVIGPTTTHNTPSSLGVNDYRVPLKSGAWSRKRVVFVSSLSNDDLLDFEYFREQHGHKFGFSSHIVASWFELVESFYRNISDQLIEGIANCGASAGHPLSRLDLDDDPEKRERPSWENADTMPLLTPKEHRETQYLRRFPHLLPAGRLGNAAHTLESVSIDWSEFQVEV